MSRSAPLFALILLLVFIQTVGSGFLGCRALDASRTDAEAAIAAAEAEGQQTFLRIQTADQEGGSVTALAAEFNEALDLLTGARLFMDEGLIDQAVASAERARGVFESVGSQAEVLGIQAATDGSIRKTTVLLAAPIAVILTTLVSYFLVRFWQRRRIERTLEMEIKEAETA